jgi:hypothetical protein
MTLDALLEFFLPARRAPSAAPDMWLVEVETASNFPPEAYDIEYAVWNPDSPLAAHLR